jgi:hypothetical protein
MYAQRHGYRLFDGTPAIDRSRPHAWSKMKVAQDVLDIRMGGEPPWPYSQHLQCAIAPNFGAEAEMETTNAPPFDWVLYLDADILITNDAITLDALVPQAGDGDIVFAEDVFGLNSGVWLVRNTEWARGLLQDWSQMNRFVRVCHCLSLL